ncbi:aromatic ring-opening dioxygenase catalytic subunit (LigB family) [Oxalobacteraceae bacterium GrIS 1.18]
MRNLPTYFVSHGGGPWPYMQDEFGTTYQQLKLALEDMPRQIGVTPKAILVISAHWQEDEFTLTSSPAPGMIYDYGGFPDYTYQISYPAPGSPELARQVQALLNNAGLKANLDEQRGFDHGMYSALFPIYPKADIPIVQLSLRKSLDPAVHIALGRAIAPLREQGILIIGSGLSFHNLRKFGPAGQAASAAFDGWLQDTLLHAEPAKRVELLKSWSDAPMAREAHQYEEHLLPLMVAVGAAELDPATCVYHETSFFGSLTVSSFRFG